MRVINIVLVGIAVIAFCGLVGSLPIRADSPQADVTALLERVDQLEARVTELENKQVIEANTIILTGESGTVLIETGHRGPQLTFQDWDGNATCTMGLMRSADTTLPLSPGLVLQYSPDGNPAHQKYFVNLYAANGGPGLQFWGAEPNMALYPLVQLYPDTLVLGDNWLTRERLQELLAPPAPETK